MAEQSTLILFRIMTVMSSTRIIDPLRKNDFIFFFITSSNMLEQWRSSILGLSGISFALYIASGLHCICIYRRHIASSSCLGNSWYGGKKWELRLERPCEFSFYIISFRFVVDGSANSNRTVCCLRFVSMANFLCSCLWDTIREPNSNFKHVENVGLLKS